MKRHRRLTMLLPALAAALHPFPCRGAFENLLPSGSVWRYHYDWNGQLPAVRTAAFDDTAWPAGPAQFGYGENDETTVLPPYPPDKPPAYTGDKPITAYFRRTLTAPAGTIVMLRLQLLRDDGAVIWLNGQEILRNNLPPGDIIPATTALLSMGGADEMLPVTLRVLQTPILPGPNLLVVEIHQATSTSNDISFDLAIDAWTGPADHDADGLPDWWESENFGHLAAAPAEDPDHDGADNAAECTAGTHPRDPASVFRPTLILDFARRPLLEWQHVPGISYHVWRSDDLLTWTPAWTGTAGTTYFPGWLDTATPYPSSRFYRVAASRTPWP